MVEVLTSFLFLGSKISVDGDCSHGIREGLFSRKEMKNLVSVSKSRDITLPTKVGILKAMVFLVVTYICESWTIRKAECQIIDAFELWCWRKFLKDTWTERRLYHSILREINPEYSQAGLMLKLKLQYFGHLMWTDNNWGQKERRASEDNMTGWHHQYNKYELWHTLRDSEGQGGLACCSPWGSKESDMGWETTTATKLLQQQQNSAWIVIQLKL